MVNFLAFLGWSPGTEEEIFSLAELAERFEIGEVHKAGAVFDKDRLDYLNGVYIRSLADGQLALRLRPFLPDRLDDGILMRLAPLLKERLVRLGSDRLAFLTETDAEVAASTSPTSCWPRGDRPQETAGMGLARDALAAVPEADFAADELEAICRGARRGMAGRRATSSGRCGSWRSRSPRLAAPLRLDGAAGEDRTLARIDAAVERLG